MATENNQLDNVNMKEQQDRWWNRKRMAWKAMAAQVVGFFWFLHMPAWYPEVWTASMVEAYTPIVTMFFIAMSSIVGAYIGFATMDDKWKNGKK